MKALRKLVVIAVVSAMAAVLIPGTASAELPTLPGVPPEVMAQLNELYGQLPPEVQQAVGDALVDLITNGPVDPIDGVGEESATPGNASASVVDFPGLVTVGKSESSTTGSKVTLLNVGGTDVLTKEGNTTGGTYGGEAAAAGDLIDQINAALCAGGAPASPLTAAPPGTCIALLTSTATTDTPGLLGSKTNSSKFTLAHVHTDALADQGVQGATIGFTSASTSRRTSGNPPVQRCTDLAQSLLLSGRGLLSSLILLNPGGVVGAALPSFSISQPC